MHPDAIRTALTPVVSELGLSLYDIEIAGTGRARTLQILVDREGGIDLDGIAAATRAVSETLDQVEIGDAPYTLEVSSPGLERPLRRVEHFHAAVDSTVSIKYRDAEGVMHRDRGVLTAAGATDCSVQVDGAEASIPYDQIVAAHTVFDWGGQEKPNQKNKKSKARATRK